jgi:hypothetical protein
MAYSPSKVSRQLSLRPARPILRYVSPENAWKTKLRCERDECFSLFRASGLQPVKVSKYDTPKRHQ